MQDKVLRCQDCYKEFIFTKKQQLQYAENGWQDPIRCPVCRERRRLRRELFDNDYVSLMQGCALRRYSRHGRGYFGAFRRR